jgi:hypothetical protein
MNDEELRSALTTLADRMPPLDVTSAALDAGKRRKLRVRSTVAAAATAIAVTAIVTPFALGEGTTKVQVSSSVFTAKLGTTLTPVDTFQVASPSENLQGPVVPQRPNCSLTSITGGGQLEPIPGGVAGAIRLDANDCSLDGTKIIGLLGASGQSLDVPVVDNPDTATPAQGLWYAGLEGHITIGLGWYGSWCGARPSGVRVSTPSGPLDVRFTLASQPTPGCQGRSESQLIQGATNVAGEPSQGARPDWRFLTATLNVGPHDSVAVGPSPSGQATIPRGGPLTNVTLTLANRSGQSIPLEPNANYLIGVHDSRGDGTAVEAQGLLPLDQLQSPVIPQHSLVVLRLPDVNIADDYRDFVGSTLTVTFQMAGLETTSTEIPLPR